MNSTINIIFDNSINFNGYFVNGLIYSYNNKITIKINPDSKENILFILIHELTHLLDLKYLKKLFINYINNELEIYNIDTQISDELICDIAGLLFSNKIINNNNFITNFKNLWKYLMHNNKVILTNEVKYKLVDDKKYGRYWIVEDSKDIFKKENNIKSLQNLVAIQLLNYNYKSLINPINNKPIKFINKSKKEFIYGKQSRILSQNDINHKNLYKLKLRLSTSIDDLIYNANIKYSSPLMHKSSLFPFGFDNFQGKVLIENYLFNYIVRIGKNNDGQSIFYDLVLNQEKRN